MSALKEKIIRLIEAEGPISVAHYMQIALGDPFHGYYISRDPFGRDFVTAPEVSQIFGELIGLFFVQAWEDRGRPNSFFLVELGPGRGTLMADMMRAAGKVRPDFTQAANIILVETSPLLRSIQKQTLSDLEPNWVLRWEEIPPGAPLYFIANEFFDALPIHQFVHGPDGWHERMVAAKNGQLIFALAPEAQPKEIFSLPRGENATAGSVAEFNPAAQAIMAGIAQRIAQSDGVGLMVDYGYPVPGYGDTLQAVKDNKYTDPLTEPGDADLTAHIDFTALKDCAAAAGADICGPVTQGALLGDLGIHLRAAQLKSVAPGNANDIDAALARLTGDRQMGILFKAMALLKPGSSHLPGFSC